MSAYLYSPKFLSKKGSGNRLKRTGLGMGIAQGMGIAPKRKKEKPKGRPHSTAYTTEISLESHPTRDSLHT